MSETAIGEHYSEFIDLFRRIKTSNDISPYRDDDLIQGDLLSEFVSEIKQFTEEQALHDPPKNVYKWPFILKENPLLPDSILHQNRPNDAWLRLDPVDNGENIPTTGAISCEISHFLANLPTEHNFKYTIIAFVDMKTFPPTLRKTHKGPESAAHSDMTNANQQNGRYFGICQISEGRYDGNNFQRKMDGHI